MIFSDREVDVLRLIRWCQYVRPELLLQILPELELSNLRAMKLVKEHTRSGAIVLTGRGREFIAGIFPGDNIPVSLSYHEASIQRRLRLSQIVMTFYRAGVQVFNPNVKGLLQSPSFYLASQTRGKGANPWGSTRVAGLAHLGELLCGVHYICPDIGRLALTDELTAMINQSASIPNIARSLIFAGESYQIVLEELEAVHPDSDSKLIDYGEAYRSVQLPVYLLPCDNTGAMQLQIMSVPDYRHRCTLAALRAQYEPPPEAFDQWDAMFQGTPFVMAADMDLRRLDAALSVAHQAGYKRVSIAALPAQAEEVFYPRYRDTGKARVFTLTDQAVSEVLGRPPELHCPVGTQYLTQEGDVVHAPLIHAHRKTGGPH